MNLWLVLACAVFITSGLFLAYLFHVAGRDAALLADMEDDSREVRLQ